MRRILLSIFVVVLAATSAFAQGGRIGVYSVPDPSSVDQCGITDAAPGVITVQIVHVDVTCATGCEFAAPLPSCTTASLIAWSANFPVNIGNPVTGGGTSIGYGANLPAPISIGSISLFGSGTTPSCCIYPIIENQNTGQLVTVGCPPQSIPALGQSGVINPDVTCDCASIVPTQKSTWGGVKALFSDAN